MARRALLSSLGDADIRLLRVFVVVAECRGIAASELELNIGKSTISKYISDLEHRIGLRICNRGPAGFSLTSEGEQVLNLANGLLAQIDEFQSRLHSIQKTLKGTIRIGIFDQSSTNPNAHVHTAIRRYDEMAPDVNLIVSLGTPSALEASVSDGSLDLAIVPIYRPSSALIYTKLYRENMNLYCGKGHALFGIDTDVMRPKPDLAAYKYAGYGFNSPNMRAGLNIGAERAASVKEEEALVLLIQSGRYLGYLADHVAATLSDSEEVWPVLTKDTSYTVEFAAVIRKRTHTDRKTDTLLQCLIDAHKSDQPVL